jgi:hypothetical protein
MSPKIYNTKEPLNLERLRLAKPTNRNGSHFIKTLDVDDPIYFLSPKCFVKQGFVKSGKKTFCDFVFSNEDSEFLAWLEDLEERSKAKSEAEDGGEKPKLADRLGQRAYPFLELMKQAKAKDEPVMWGV